MQAIRPSLSYAPLVPGLAGRVADLSRRVGLKSSRVTTRLLSRATPRSDLVRLGSPYGGWWVPGGLLSATSICYLAGVGEDVTFDLAVVERFGCEVWAFDPTPRAQAHAASVDEPRFHFLPRGLWSERTTMRFYAPRDPTHVSHSITNLQQTSDYFEADCWSVSDLMSDLGHAHLDLLKLDIEGAEGPVIEAMLGDGIRPSVLCVEFDAAEPPWTTLRRIRDIVSHGYLLVHVENRNYVFASEVA
jgi:FkbM family methyltransferase